MVWDDHHWGAPCMKGIARFERRIDSPPADRSNSQGMAMPAIAVMMAAWLMVISGYGNRKARNAATIMAISIRLTEVSSAATGQVLWAATTSAIMSATAT